MTYAVIQHRALDLAAGALLQNVDIRVRLELPGLPSVQLYADKDGNTAIGNPTTAGYFADGKIRAYCEAGFYRVELLVGGVVVDTFYDVPVSLQQGVAGALPREALTANRTYYVRTDGVDTNDGLTDDAAGAFLTLQKAYDTIADSLDGRGFQAFVEVRGGAYTSGILSSKGFVGFNGAGAVTFRGQPRSTATVTMTLASPCVMTWPLHGFSAGQPFYLTTSGALPTGVAAYTKYYVLATGLTASTFQFALTPGGSAINSSVSQSGTHTAASLPNVFVTTTNADCFSIGAEQYAAGKNGLGQLTIGGMCLSTVTAGQCVNVSGGGVSVAVGTPGYPIEFAACAQDHAVTNHSGWLVYGTNNIVSGGALIHAAAISNSTLAMHGTTLVFLTRNAVVPAFTYFAFTDTNGSMFANAMTFTNGAIVTGTRYFSGNGGVIYTNGSATYLPGNATGVEYIGGKYIGSSGPTGLTLLTSGIQSYVDIGAWTAFTPIATAQTPGVTPPTFTSVTGRYKQIGKTVIAQMEVIVNAVGTGVGSLRVTLPFTAAAYGYVGSAFEVASTGKSGAAIVSPVISNDYVSIRDAAGITMLASSARVIVTIVYEVP